MGGRRKKLEEDVSDLLSCCQALGGVLARAGGRGSGPRGRPGSSGPRAQASERSLGTRTRSPSDPRTGPGPAGPPGPGSAKLITSPSRLKTLRTASPAASGLPAVQRDAGRERDSANDCVSEKRHPSISSHIAADFPGAMRQSSAHADRRLLAMTLDETACGVRCLNVGACANSPRACCASACPRRCGRS